MKTAAAISTLALVASTMAQRSWDPLPDKRDVATIQNVIQQVSGAMQTLDTTVKAFNGQDFTQLATDAANLKTVLTQGTQQIMATDAISAQDAITLQSSLSPVQTLGTSLVTDITAKKDQVQQAGLCTIVQQETADIGTSANGLITATVQKVPANLQAVATQLTSGFTSQLNDLSASFAPGNCTNAAGGSAAAAGIAFGNSSLSTASAGTTTASTAKSAAVSNAGSVVGVIVAVAAVFTML